MKRPFLNPCSSVFLCGCLLLATSGVFGQSATVTASGASGTPGTTVTLTVSFSGSSVDSLSFGLLISPQGTAPALSGTLGFAVDPSMPSPSVVDTGFASNKLAISWLTLSPAISGTKTLGTVRVTIPAGAQSGQTYLVQITGGSASIAGAPVPVTPGPDAILNVTGISTSPPVLALSTNSLSFSAATGGPAPSPQAVTVANGGGGTLTWTAATDARATWLSISPASGTGAGQITVSANTSSLAVGNYSGTVTVTAAGATGSPQMVNVTLTVTQPPVIALRPASLTFSAVQAGANPSAQTVAVSNSGGGSLAWLAVPTSTGNWLAVSPTLPTVGAGSLTASANIAGLAAGSYSGSISVAASGASNSPQTINVTLNVAANPNPVLALSAKTMSFNVAQGGTNPPAQTFTVANAGGGTMPWTVSVSGNPPWLSVSPTSGSNRGTVTVTANAGGLAANTYSTTITVLAPGAASSPASIPVTLTVTPPVIPVLAVNTLALNFSGGVGDTLLQQTLAISNTGNGTLTWTASPAVDGTVNWLSVTPNSGSGAFNLSVKADTSGLGAGTYKGSITVAAAGATNSPQTVNVTLTLTAATRPVMALNPALVQFAFPVNAQPSTQALQVQNIGIGSFGWTATSATQTGGNWLAIQPSSSSTPSTIQVTATPGTLIAGNYSGTITIQASDSTTGASPQTAAVTLSVGGPLVGPNAVVNAASFSLDATLSPGSLASLFGTNLASGIAGATSLPLPLTLGGVQVLVNGIAAPLLYVSPTQINFQIPYGTLGSNATVVVVSNNIRGISNNMKLRPQVPGIFFSGQNVAAALNADSSANSAANPAAAGSVIQIYATGLGATNPPAVDGQAGASREPLNRTIATPVVLIGGVQATVQFSGLAPGFVGLYQVNAVIPPLTPARSDVTVQIQANGQNSNTATIAVK